jgi:enterochelin esterase-like enzyme
LLFAQSGKVFDDLSLPSEILNMDRKYAIYLPPDYETSQRSYPVLYLLHGSGDDQTGWIQFGEVLSITDQAIKEGKSTAMIIIMPDGDTGQRGYFNNPKGGWDYENFFFEELIPYVEKTYRIKGEKRYRAIAGLSMGGGGTFMYALHRPDLFSSACPLSAYIGPSSPDDMDRILLRNGVENLTPEQKENYYNNHNALALIENGDVEKIKSVRWYIDCGDDDFLYEGNSVAHIVTNQKLLPGIPCK